MITIDCRGQTIPVPAWLTSTSEFPTGSIWAHPVRENEESSGENEDNPCSSLRRRQRGADLRPLASHCGRGLSRADTVRSAAFTRRLRSGPPQPLLNPSPTAALARQKVTHGPVIQEHVTVAPSHDSSNPLAKSGGAAPSETGKSPSPGRLDACVSPCVWYCFCWRTCLQNGRKSDHPLRPSARSHS